MSGFRSGGPDLRPYINESHHVQVFVCRIVAVKHVAPWIGVDLHQDFGLGATGDVYDILAAAFV